jgi:mannose-6-phosphate isomerase-like protein (cupin superfamily)
MPPDGTATIAQSAEDLRAKVKAQIVEGEPTFFKLEAQLPKQGRTDTPLAASDKMWIVLKTYAADGENGLHAHPHEDHTFVVLQGEATFYGPNGETRTIGKNEGVLLPHGTFYWFACLTPTATVPRGGGRRRHTSRRGRRTVRPTGRARSMSGWRTVAGWPSMSTCRRTHRDRYRRSWC